MRIVRLMEVMVKRMADQVVSLVSRLAAPRGPKAVCDPWPPKAPARSALLPCCSRTTPIRKNETITCNTITKYRRKFIGILEDLGRKRASRKWVGYSYGAEEGT